MHAESGTAAQRPQSRYCGIRHAASGKPPDSVEQIFSERNTLLAGIGSKEVKRKFSALLDDFQPDVVHLNNIHTQLSPLIAELAHRRGIKVVWTLHDLKLLCPRYDCLRNGETICEACFTDKHKVLENKCMKNSWLASILAYKEARKWIRVFIPFSCDMRPI